MASFAIPFFFFIDIIKINQQRTNFCNIVTKVKKIANSRQPCYAQPIQANTFPGNFVYKALRALL